MVEHLAAAQVRALSERIAAARRDASAAAPETRGDADDPAYWERVFEINAATVLGALDRVRLQPQHTVRYRFYGRRGGDLLVRPFVARTDTDVATARRLLDWHAPPDAPGHAASASRDVELLYRYFEFERSSAGYFEYWLAVQEVWASQRWIHSSIVADAAELSAIAAGPDWRIEHPVERAEPAVVMGADGTAQIAVLLHSPLGRHSITFHRVLVDANQAVSFAESLLIAQGPRGYLA